MTSLLRKLWYALVYIIAGSLVLAAVTLTLARLLLPAADQYRQDVQVWASDLIGQAVTITSMDADWQGMEPQLVLNGISFIDPQDQQEFFSLETAKIGFDLWQSIVQRQVALGTLVVSGARLNLQRHADGRLGIGSISRGEQAADSGNNRRLAAWLLERKLLRLENSEIIWEDQKRQRAPRNFLIKQLSLQNDGPSHYLQGEVALPQELGQQLRIHIGLNGNPFVGKDWRAEAFLSAKQLAMSHWLESSWQKHIQIKQGVLDANVWMGWDKGELSHAYGQVHVDQPHLQSPIEARLQAYESINSQFALRQDGQDWRIEVDDFTIDAGDRQWPPSRFSLRLDSELKNMDAYFSYLNIGILGGLVSLSDTLDADRYQQLDALAPQGVIKDLRVSFTEQEEAPNWRVEGDLFDFSNQSYNKIPGVQRLSGTFSFNQQQGTLLIDDYSVPFEYPHIFDHDMFFSRLFGKLHWDTRHEALQLVFDDFLLENNEFSVSAAGRVELDKQTGSFIDVQARINEPTRVEDAVQYLPVRVIKPKTVKWLRRALHAGTVDGDFIMYGRMKNFPFAQGDGKFELNLQGRDIVLDYARGWPHFQQVGGDFVLTATGMEFNSHNGSVFDNALQKVKVKIEDFRHQPTLQISGEVSGSSDGKLRYLHQSPLQQAFARHIDTLSLEGQSDLFLELDIPLKAINKTAVQGYVDFDNNHFQAENWLLDISDFNGRLSFNRQGIEAESLRGQFGKIPMNVAIRTTPADQPERSITITQSSELDDQQWRFVLDQFAGHPQWADWLSGRAPVDIKVDIPIATKQEKAVTLTASSNLQGMGVTLPAPMYKDPESSRQFSVELAFGKLEHVVSVKLQPVAMKFEMTTVGNQVGISRGAIGFNQDVKLPAEHGYHFLGRLGEFSWSNWEPILFPKEKEKALVEARGASTSQYFDLKVGQLELYGAFFDNVAVQASQSAQGWSVHVDSAKLEGDIFVPRVLRSSPLVMNMDRMLISSRGVTGKDVRLSPEKMPEFDIKSKQFEYNNIRFGSLQLKTARTEEGMRLRTLRMKTRETTIAAQGDWFTREGEQVSRFDIKVDSSDLGKALENWGYAETIDDGETDLDISASWPGAPTDFDFGRLNGQVKLDVKDGRVLDVSPGASRLFGLLSVQALPRRLILDFSDVFAKGMQFDTMQGEFKLEGGNAFTSGLAMDGPSAKIDMAGRIGLVAQDYDQIVSVTPKVGASIPLLGALTVAPQIGATLFVMQKLFEKQIDEVATFQYSVTGSWAEPKIKKLSRPALEVDKEILE